MNIVLLKSSMQVRIYHNQPLLGQDNQQNIPAHLILQPQQIVSSAQSQCQRVQRDGQITDFRKFNKNFVLSSPKGQRTNVSYRAPTFLDENILPSFSSILEQSIVALSKKFHEHAENEQCLKTVQKQTVFWDNPPSLLGGRLPTPQKKFS